MNKVAGGYNERQTKLILPLVQQINNISDEYDNLSDEQIKEKSLTLKEIISKISLPKKVKDKDWNLKLESDISPLDQYMPEAFALVKQACKRLVGTTYLVKGVEQVWNMIPYDVQIIWWINLHKGKISEMKTGEGKTLVATMPAYLNALTGRGVHIVTVNDYLTSRDSDQMKIVFEFLGLSVGCVTKAVQPHMRREEYAKDITYVENSELGFDYLRDNLVKSLDERSLLRRPLHYGIVDEVDSILIDESRTPLIISEPDAEPTEKYAYYAQIVPLLIPSRNKKKVSKWFLHDMINDNKNDHLNIEDEWDYHVDEKTKTVALSSQGIAKLEEILKVENLYRDLGYEEIHHIENALKAHACYINGKEYLVNNGEILIIDENTGRAQVGRRFSQGLHQAIEAKEQVTIQRESKTLATITYQNFFKLYYKLSGMTGTATTEGEEFDSIYNLHVLAIPTNRDVIRVDHNDKVYFNQNAKRKFVLDQISFSHEIGQPLLIGTSSIQTSEFMSSILNKDNIIHSVLNAKFHEQEAQIISRAGKYWSVVVATNMAWRGTDIKLEEWLNERLANNYANWIERMISWNNKEKKKYIINASLYSNKEFDYTLDAIKNILNISEEMIIWSYKSEQSFGEYKIKINLNTKKKFSHEVFANIMISHKESVAWEWIARNFHYGLGIIGTEKHESRRIDNQLRGRAGRQWDAGFSVFYVALDDSIMRKMGGEKIQGVASLLLPKSELENLELTQSQFTSSIIRAQKQMEWRHFGIRKHLFDYDSVIDKQRQSIYWRRDSILQALYNIYHPNLKNQIDSSVIDNIVNLVQQSVDDFIITQQTLGTSEDELIELINKEYWLQLESSHIKKSIYNESTQHISAHIISKLNDAKEILWEENFTRICANIYLSMIDKYRVSHIDEMQYLREKVGLVGYAQLDPLVIYKKESYDKYQALNKIINQSTVNIIANTDFISIADQIKNQQQQHDMQIIQAQQEANEDIMQKLKSAAGNNSSINTFSNNKSVWSTNTLTISSNNEFEILEIDWQEVQQVNNSSISRKNRPNDKVNVRYKDGHMERDVKYKKVSDDIKSGKAEII
jgi:preprotein translocase subunit SecA